MFKNTTPKLIREGTSRDKVKGKVKDVNGIVSDGVDIYHNDTIRNERT